MIAGDTGGDGMATDQKSTKRTKPPWDGSPLGDPVEAAKRRERLVAKYQARRARLAAHPNPKAETLQEFGERVFGSPEGQQVLLEWMRENSAWLIDDEDAPDSSNGR